VCSSDLLEEIRRLTEDKAFSTSEMRNQLGISPLPLQEGLARTFFSGVESSQQLDD